MKHTALLLFALSACHVGSETDVATNHDAPPWDDFLADAYREPWSGGVFVVDGDTPMPDRAHLRDFYDALYGDGELLVHRAGGADARWNDTQKLNLTYCVSNSFGGNKTALLTALDAATGMWEAAANIDFVYVPAQDASCTASNGNVVFDV